MVEGGVAGFGMDIVRGLSGFGGSEMSGGPCESVLNSFCCILRTLVAMVGVQVQRPATPFATVLHRVDDVVEEVIDSTGIYRVCSAKRHFSQSAC